MAWIDEIEMISFDIQFMKSTGLVRVEHPVQNRGMDRDRVVDSDIVELEAYDRSTRLSEPSLARSEKVVLHHRSPFRVPCRHGIHLVFAPLDVVYVAVAWARDRRFRLCFRPVRLRLRWSHQRDGAERDCRGGSHSESLQTIEQSF